MKAVILAAGLGTRLYPLSERTPKCLIPINGVPNLQLQIECLKRHGIHDAVVVVGGEGPCWTKENVEKIKKIHDNLIVNDKNLSTANAFSLYLGIKNLAGGPVLAIDGDLAFDDKTLEDVLESGFQTLLLVRRLGEVTPKHTTVLLEGTRVRAVGIGVKSNVVHSGLIKIGDNAFNAFKKELPLHETGPLADPVQALCEEHAIHAIESENGKWININSAEDLKWAEKNLE